MKVKLEPEIIPGDIGSGVFTHAEMRQAAEAMFKSSEYINYFGDPEPPTKHDTSAARKIVMEQRPITAVQNSAIAQHLRALLTEYDEVVAQSAAQIRLFVTNGLLEEAAPGAKNRLRALELLGKIREVGLFTERSEVTVKHQTTSELEQTVREKLLALTNRNRVAQDVAYTEMDATVMRSRIENLADVLVTPPSDEHDGT